MRPWATPRQNLKRFCLIDSRMIKAGVMGWQPHHDEEFVHQPGVVLLLKKAQGQVLTGIWDFFHIQLRDCKKLDILHQPSRFRRDMKFSYYFHCDACNCEMTGHLLQLQSHCHVRQNWVVNHVRVHFKRVFVSFLGLRPSSQHTYYGRPTIVPDGLQIIQP